MFVHLHLAMNLFSQLCLTNIKDDVTEVNSVIKVIHCMMYAACLFFFLFYYMSKHLVHTVILHAACFLSLLLSPFSSSISVPSQLQPALYVSLYLLIHCISAKRILPDCICRRGRESFINCQGYCILLGLFTTPFLCQQ